jgi:hypothetical protein
VTADDVEIRGVDVLGARSRISSESKSTALTAGGDAGEIVVEAAHTITVADEGVVSVASAGIGGGGSILLDAGDTIRLENRALVSAEAAGARDAGRITLMAGYGIEGVDSEIVTRAAVGGGGQVVLETSELVHLIRTDIDAQVNAGGGNGGDIEIDPQLVVLNDSDLIANAIDGNGGSILIVANQLLSSKDSGRFFSSQFGLDGSEVVTAPQSEVPSNLASIQQSVIDASDLMAERCDLRSERSGSFTIVKGVAARSAADDVLQPQWLEEDGVPAMCEAPNDARSLE